MTNTPSSRLRARLRQAEQMHDHALAVGSELLVAYYEQVIINYELLIMAAEQGAAARRRMPPEEPQGEASHAG